MIPQSQTSNNNLTPITTLLKFSSEIWPAVILYQTNIHTQVFTNAHTHTHTLTAKFQQMLTVVPQVLFSVSTGPWKRMITLLGSFCNFKKALVVEIYLSSHSLRTDPTGLNILTLMELQVETSWGFLGNNEAGDSVWTWCGENLTHFI